MQYLWSMALGLTLVGCMPQEMTEEEELNRARAEKNKHPEQWRKLEKITPAEATQQQRKNLEEESVHNRRMIAIHSRYRSG